MLSSCWALYSGWSGWSSPCPVPLLNCKQIGSCTVLVIQHNALSLVLLVPLSCPTVNFYTGHLKAGVIPIHPSRGTGAVIVKFPKLCYLGLQWIIVLVYLKCAELGKSTVHCGWPEGVPMTKCCSTQICKKQVLWCHNAPFDIDNILRSCCAKKYEAIVMTSKIKMVVPFITSCKHKQTGLLLSSWCVLTRPFFALAFILHWANIILRWWSCSPMHRNSDKTYLRLKNNRQRLAIGGT